uniref:Uncharacterized protein n=1 Tax=Arundo donax TaxID=35708 RepID=A0A0A9FNK1_ARUDO
MVLCIMIIQTINNWISIIIFPMKHIRISFSC